MRLEQEKDVGRLLRGLNHRSHHARQDAARALGRIGDPRAIEPLILALNDGYPNVQSAAVEALVLIGEPAVEPIIYALRGREGRPIEAMEALIDVLRDGDRHVRRAAAIALGEIGDSRARGAANQRSYRGSCR